MKPPELLEYKAGRRDFQGANLQGANLQGANLQEANLQWANLQWANLQRANLQEANLRGARYDVVTMLRAFWPHAAGDDALTTEMMRWDAYAHPDPDAFVRWSEGGPCPCENIGRWLYFPENRSLFQPGPPTMSLWGLFAALADCHDILLRGGDN